MGQRGRIRRRFLPWSPIERVSRFDAGLVGQRSHGRFESKVAGIDAGTTFWKVAFFFATDF
jgi:hypothetical protein